MAVFGKNANSFLLKEGDLFVGTVASPELIGTVGNGDPINSFTLEDVGYFRQGSTNVEIPREYAEFLAGTPGIKIRKDLIRKDLMLTVEVAQVNPDILELAMGSFVQKGFTDGGFTGDLAWLGSDEPVQPRKAYVLKTFLTDGVPFNIAIFSGAALAEEVGFTLSGTEHAIKTLRVEAFHHPNFGTTGVDAQKHYGLAWIDNS